MTSAASSSRPTGVAMTRSRLTRSSRRPASGWPRWSRRTGRQDHWLAVPFLPGGPSGPTQRHSRPAGPMTLREVDAFREEIRDTFLGATRSPVRSDDVRGKQFPSADDGPRYDKKQVDAFLDAAGIRLAAMERREIPGVVRMSTDRPDRPLVSDAILAGWAEWADSTRFSTSRRREGYDTAEVDAFREEVRDTFLGVRQPPDEWPTVQDLSRGPPQANPRRDQTTSAANSSRPTGLATTWSRLTPSLIRPNRGWRRCGRPTRGRHD